MRHLLHFPLKLKRPRPTVLRLLQGLIVLGVVTEIVLLAHTPSASQALALATSRQPDAYTELGFMRPADLPRQIKPGATYQFNYQVVSHQTDTTTYQVTVTIMENGQPHRLRTDTLVLAPGQSATQPVAFTTAKPGTKLEIIVELPAQHQQIHFGTQS